MNNAPRVRPPSFTAVIAADASARLLSQSVFVLFTKKLSRILEKNGRDASCDNWATRKSHHKDELNDSTFNSEIFCVRE